MVDGEPAITIEGAYDEATNTGCDYTTELQVWDASLNDYTTVNPDAALMTFDTSNGDLDV